MKKFRRNIELNNTLTKTYNTKYSLFVVVGIAETLWHETAGKLAYDK